MVKIKRQDYWDSTNSTYYVLYVFYRKPDFKCSFIILIKTELGI